MLTKVSAGRLCCLAGVPFALLLGCGSNSTSAASSPLVGKWQGVETKWQFLEFTASGTVTQSTVLSDKVRVKPGTYRVVDGSNLIVTRRIQQKDAQPTDIPIGYSISGNHLTTRARNGFTTEFERVK